MKKNQTCVVRDCDSTEIKNADLKFYPIPKEENIKKKWLKAINRSQDELTKRSKVCSKHFKSTDYTVTRFNYTMGNKNDPGTDKSVCEWKVLKTEVVPSLNLPEKSTFKIKISKKDNNKEVKVEEVKVTEEKDREKPHRMPKRPAPPPVETPKETPSRSRRQASKEALKQMQLLLDDENDAVEIASDEDFSYLDIIPVDPSPPPPPKKKYKLSHRKSSDGNVNREVLVLKSITNRNAENTLELDCWVEPLDDVQTARIKKAQEEEKEIQSKLDSLISKGNAKVIHKGDLNTIIEISEYVQSAIQAAQVPPNPPPVVLNKALAANQSYQLVMDPRLGLIVGAVNQTPNSTPGSTPQKVYQGKVQVAQNLHQTPTTSANNQTRMRTRRGVVGGRTSPPPPSPVVNTPPITTRSGLQTRSMPTKPTPPPPAPKTVTTTRNQIATRSTPITNKSTSILKNPPMVKSAPPPAKKAVPVATPPPPVTRTRQSSSASLSNTRPSEDNVEGGLATGGGAGGGQAKKVVVDLTADDGKSVPDSKEIAFNKLQGKTYPSLVVVARPHLRVQDVSVDRPKLDAKVKSVLMHAPTKFTEWLIQQGLVRSEQKCSTHTTTQLKLGMYSDVSKFPYSGGYVWISECCPHRFVSVFSGSLFEGSPHPPMVILKLLYHWSCQTNIQNVTQWVKVDNLYVKGMFTWLRAITTVALHTHLRQLGGPGTKIEVGVISLGTTSQDGNQRQVKVEVLGILETASKLIRLRAVEPQTDGDRNYKKRFSKILEPIQQWVHPESILVADLTVDKQTLNNMGFVNVIQSSSNEYGQNNRQIMEYLRRIVPRMFQNTLSLLSRQIIQQFLDELVWREWFGTTSLQAFDNIVLHLAEQTRYDNLTLITRLNRVAQFPFKNWALPSSVINSNTTTTTKTADNSAAQKKQRNRKQELNVKPPQQVAAKSTQQLTAKSVQQIPVEISRPPKSISPDVPEQMVPLENYYYGTIDNYSKTPKITLNMKCPFCKSVFDNNILLMNHLFKHAHNVSQDAQLCRYCLTSVPTANDLLKHIATSHPAETKFDNGFVCLICETQYMNPFILGKHMSKEHCPSELPYQCGSCGYRCSNHKQAIDHFYKTHDNGPTIQCPFCLKSTTVFTSSRNINQNMNYFIQHLQKHQRKQFARRCGKCNLWFVQKDVLRDHQSRMHVSQRGKPRLVPWNAPRNGVMVPKSRMDKYPGDADVINFSTLTLNVAKNLMCKECNTSMSTPKHFPSFESCQNPNCQYSTCCTNAMQEHNAKCSKTQNPIEKEKLTFEMFCICGYSDTDGNQMARHLAICERKSAYPSRTEAQAAIVTHSMLDVLGLVRKPDETKKDETDIPVLLDNNVKDNEVSVADSEKMEVDEVKEIVEEVDDVKIDVEDSKTVKDKPDVSKDVENKETSRKKLRDRKREKTMNESSSETMEVTEDVPTEKLSADIEESKSAQKGVSESTLEDCESTGNDVIESTEKEVRESIESEVPKSTEKDVSESTGKDVSESTGKDVSESTENDVFESTEKDVSESTQKDISESTETDTSDTIDKEVSETIEKEISETTEPVCETTKKEVNDSREKMNVDESSELTDKEEFSRIAEESQSIEEANIADSVSVNSEENVSITKDNDISETEMNDSDSKVEIEQKIEETKNEENSSNIDNAIENEINENVDEGAQFEESCEKQESTKDSPAECSMESDLKQENQQNEPVQEEMSSEDLRKDDTSSECNQPDGTNSKEVDDLVESTFKSLEDRAIEEFDVLSNEDEEEDDKTDQDDETNDQPDVSESQNNESDDVDQTKEQLEDSEILRKNNEEENLNETITNHVRNDDDATMETADIPMESKSQESDITTDDIKNFISDIVVENETDVTRYSEKVEKIEDSTMASPNKDIDVPVTMESTVTELFEGEEATPMETD